MNDFKDKGAHYFRCDFQVHTPRDINWHGKPCITPDDRKAYAARLIDAARSKGLDAIAISDHHDLCFFGYIKVAASEETDIAGNLLAPMDRIVVFPAVELTLNVPCQAILILDADFPEGFLPQVLTALAISPSADSESKTVATIPLNDITTLERLKSELDKHDFLRNRYIVLPNVTTKGHQTLLRTGNAQKYKNMPCVGGYLDGSIDQCGVGERRILAGEDKGYGNKRIALFQTSDSRSEDHAQLGKHSTWVKWAVPTAEAIRQACLAQDSRIAQEAPHLPGMVIRSLHVSNSDFLGPVDLVLNPQYSALIGSRGTGKSTILEYLRWALCDEHNANHEDEAESIGIRQRKLIENTLKKYEATVEVRFEVNGVPHLVRRRSATDEILLKIGEGELQPCAKEDVKTLLPVEAYSQKQLSRVGHRVDDLNSFVRSGIKTELDTIEDAVLSLAASTRQVYGQLRRKQAVEKALREDRLEIQSLSQQAQAIRESFTGLSPEQQQLLSRQPAYLEGDLQVRRWEAEVAEVRTSISALVKRLSAIPSATKEPLELHPEKEALQNIHSIVSATSQSLSTLASRMEVEIGKLQDENGNRVGPLLEAHQHWVTAKASFDSSYESAKAAASSHETQLKALADIELKIRNISLRISTAESEIATFGAPEEAFRLIREDWRALHRSRGDLYAGQCDRLTELSDGAIRAAAYRGRNIRALDEKLRTITKGSGLRGQRIEDMLQRICQAADPVALWDGLLDELEKLGQYRSSDPQAKKPDCPTLIQVGFADGDLARLADRITPENWLELALTSLDDETEFQYRTRDQEYIPFENASAGQQATALLLTLLNQEGPPLIIDQPEDDLDNQIVFEIVKKIWKAKTRRQLIFTSHNANLVVNGDAELVVWCDYRISGDQSGGRIAGEGAIDMESIRDAIKTIMEGGEKAFKLRLDKYGF